MADRSINLGTLFTADVDRFLRETQRILTRVSLIQSRFNRMGQAARGFAQVERAVTQSTKAIDKQTKSVERNAKATTGMAAAWGRVVSSMKTLAAFGIAGAAIYSVVNALKVGTQEIINYDQALKNLQAITRATDAEVFSMGETIREVAEETKFSTGEVAEGMVLLGQAGFSATEAMQSMSAVANLATGTLSDMRLTSDLLTTTVRAFGLEASESARVADVMANAINRSKLTIDKLRIAFNFVGAAASQTGLSLEETAASMMVLANNGIRASTIGTGLRQVLSRLLAPNRNLREEFEAQGIQLDKVNPRLVGYQTAMRNLVPILVDMEKRTVNMTKAYRLFGLRGAQAVSILARAFATEGANSFDDMYTKVLDVGTASDMAAKQMEGLGVKLKNLADRLKLIAVALGTGGLIDVFKVLVDGMRAVAVGIVDFLETPIGRISTSFVVWTAAITGAMKALQLLNVVLISKAIPAILGYALGVGKSIINLVRMVNQIGLMNTALTVQAGIAAGALGPLLAIGAAIAAIVVAYRYMRGATQRQIDAMVKQKNETETLVSTLKAHEGALDEVLRKQNEGKDVTKEHETIIKRLKEAYEESTTSITDGIKTVDEAQQNLYRNQVIQKLDSEIRTSSENIVQNLASVREAHEALLKQQVMQSERLIKLYRNQAKEESLWAGRWKAFKEFFVVGVAEPVMMFVQDMMTLLGRLGDAIVTVTEKMGRLGKVMKFIQPGLLLVSKAIGTLDDVVDTFNTRAERFAKEIEAGSEAAREADRELIKMAQAIKELTKGKASAEEIMRFMRDMQGIELNADQVREIMKALSEGEDLKITEEIKELENALANVPNAYKKIYDQLDTIRKASFLKHVKSIEREAAAAKDTASIMLKTEKDRFAEVEYLYAKGLVDFIEGENEKKLSVEERYQLELQMLDELGKSYEEETKRKIDLEQQIYDARLKAAKTDIEADRLAQERNDRIVALEEQLSLKLQGIQAAKNYAIELLERENAKKRANIYKDTTKAYIKELEGRIKAEDKAYDEIAKKAGDITKRANEILQETNAEARKRNLGEEERYAADVRAVYEQLMQARRTNDIEAYGTALEMTRGLAREVKNANGEMVQSYNQTAYQQRILIETIIRETEGLRRNAERERDATVSTIRATINQLNTLIDQYAKKIDEAGTKELKLQTADAIGKIQETTNWVQKFKEMWEKIESKSITLTVNYQTTGDRGGGTGGAKSVEDVMAENAANRSEGGLVGFKKGGLVSAPKSSVSPPQKLKMPAKFKKGGSVRPKQKTDRYVEIRAYKEGGTVDRITAIHTDSNVAGGTTEKMIGKTLVVERKEGGTIRSDSRIVNDIFRFKEGGLVHLKEGGRVESKSQSDRSRVAVFKDGGKIEVRDKESKVATHKEGGKIVIEKITSKDVSRFKEGGTVDKEKDDATRIEKTILKSVDRFREGGFIESREGGQVERHNISDKQHVTVDKSDSVQSNVREVSKLKEGGKIEKDISTKVSSDKSKESIQTARTSLYVQRFRDGGRTESTTRSTSDTSSHASTETSRSIEKMTNIVSDIFRFKEGGTIQTESGGIEKVVISRIEKESDHVLDTKRDGGAIQTTVFKELLKFKEGGSIERQSQRSDKVVRDRRTESRISKMREGGNVAKITNSIFRFAKFKEGGTVRDSQVARYDSTKSDRETIDRLRSGGLTRILKFREGGSVRESSVQTKSATETTNVIDKGRSSERVIEHFKSGGGIRALINAGWHWAKRGWKLPGYGGGDKVPIIAEAGEFVVRKEAVKMYNEKYGSNFINSINNMSFSMPSEAGVAQKRLGGAVQKIAKTHYQTGGEVQGFSSGSEKKGEGVKVYLQPTYMMGDRRSALAAAKEIEKYLNYNKHRKG